MVKIMIYNYQKKKFTKIYSLRVYENLKTAGKKLNLKRRKYNSPETRKKISISNIGKHSNYGWKRLGKYHTEETKQKISKIHLGKKLSEEHKKNLSLSHKGNIPGNKGKKVDISKYPNYGMRGKHHSKETKELLREQGFKRTQNPEFKLHKNIGVGKKFFVQTPFQGTRCLRSSYEKAYYDYLIKNNINFFYEKQMFKTSIGGYIPDFYLPDTNEWIEIKGWMIPTSQKKIDECRSVHNINLIVLGHKELKEMRLI